MISSIGEVETPLASTYLTRLCKHFSKKIEVVYDEAEGHARFPFGDCRLLADTRTLSFHCKAEDSEAMARLQDVINQHVGMFTRRNPLLVNWTNPGDEGAGPDN